MSHEQRGEDRLTGLFERAREGNALAWRVLVNELNPILTGFFRLPPASVVVSRRPRRWRNSMQHGLTTTSPCIAKFVQELHSWKSSGMRKRSLLI